MKKGTKKLVTGLFTAGLAFGLVACSGNETSNSEENRSEKSDELSGEVTLWTASLAGEPFDTYFDNIEKKFEELHPDLDVIIEDIPQNEMEKKVLTSLTGDDVPDVVNLNPHYMSNIAAQGGLLDLTELLNEETKKSFVEGAYVAGFYDEKLYALPWYLTTTVSWYNGDHFEQAGITETPADFKGVYETAKAVTEATGKPSFYQVINDGNTIIEKMATLANGGPIVKDGKAVFANNKAILEYFTLTQKMYQEGLMPQENAEGSFSGGQELYMAGNVSFLESGVTFLGPIESGAPDIYAASKAGQPLSGADAPMNVAVMNFAVPSKSQNPDAAVALTEFVLNAENQLEFAKTAGTVLPSTLESLEDDYFQNPGDSQKALGMLEASKSLERSKVLLKATKNSALLRESAKNAFVRNLQGKVTPEEALKELEAEWNESFEKTDEKVTF
ncbi:hypothetical protein AF332_19185 [Sporosarcina globispora]|uniref:Sugar ABC transporter substrate-binding protein n=1 Tax=Sporosarcina globispora TaxID=1459 RepID=A0A0M0GFT2_SPOGL|nr:extracellular solute-binding protein [Sporosarcina globispora]KON88714.1 hypothetical protein AF332_19185 [Sporosarcina globispora]